MTDLQPYREPGITRVEGAEIARLTEENDDLRRCLARRGLALEGATAGAFAVAGVTLISTLYGDVAAWSIAWMALVGGAWGLLKVIARSGRIEP